MRLLHASVFLSGLCALAGVAATTPTKTATGAPAKTTAKKVTSSAKVAVRASASSTAKKVTSATKKVSPVAASTVRKATGKTVASAASKGRKAPAPPPAFRPRQLNPTPDRYKEIQQALVDKGYLKSDPSGVWDAASTDAMQRFQTDRKLTPTGKITAAALIELGLGPKTAGVPDVEPPASGAVSPPGAVPPAISPP
jgi:hypothetical protein